MKKRTSAYKKDIAREIRRSIGRFMSVFLIVALGTGFFAGIKSTMPDMKESAADFFEENNLMDLKLVSNVGFRYEDLQAVEDLDGVSGVQAGYSSDVYYNYDGQNQVVKVMSYSGGEDILNKPILIEGRLPQNSGECVVENTMKTPDSYKIGEKLTLSAPGKDGDIHDYFKHDTFEVVGIVASPLYIGFERDATTIGSGSVNSFMLIPEEDFTLGFYTELYVRFDGLDREEPFSDKYTDEVEEKKQPVIAAFENSVDKRMKESKQDAIEQLDKAQENIDAINSLLALDENALAQYIAQLESDVEALRAQAENGTALDRVSLAQQETKLQTAQGLYASRLAGDTSVDEHLSAQAAQGQAQADEIQAQIDSIPDTKIYDYTRFSSNDYASFAGDSEKIDAIAKVFPVFFVFIAALVCLTTMTRMVDEKRTEIGTYKALGYSSAKIMAKYLIYALVPTVTGTLFGTAIGFKLFPYIIYNSYKILYNIPSIDTPFRVDYALWCMAVAVIAVGATVVASCYASMSAKPAQLMRPKAPPAGKRVFLEKITPLWKRLGFLTKVTLRNLLRYKKRFAMTLIGVAGCTALIMTAFGIKHSISKIVDLQFGKILQYDAVTVLNKDSGATDDDINALLDENEDVEDHLLISETDCTLNANDLSYGVSLMVPQQPQKLNDFIRLDDCKSGEKLTVADGEAVITEKITQLMGLKVGDEIEIEIPEKETVKLKISSIAENYSMHYIYISPKDYEKLYGEEPQFNQAYLSIADGTVTADFSQQLISKDEFLGIVFLDEKAETFFSSIESLNAIVWLLIICAALLAFIVLYDLANINITERVREIATLKVLGFYDSETSAYIYRENIYTTVIGIILGWGMGLVLHRFVVLTAEVDLVMFAREMVWYAYILSALLTALFAVMVNVVLHFKLKKIDMVESLKSIE